MKSFRSIVITGASSGIGEALARDYGRPGVRLALTGRDVVRLDAVAGACRASGAEVDAQAIDVTEHVRLSNWLLAQDASRPIDLLVANAGVSIEQTAASAVNEALTRKTFAINVDGVFNTVFPLLPAMRARQIGQIALMASLAGFIGLPNAAAYNASKAALRVWGESLRHALRAEGIGVSVICPGFVKSRMNAGNEAPMPFMMSTGRASSIIRSGLSRNQARIAFPLGTKAAVWLGSTLPGGATDRLMRYFAR